MLNEFWKTWKNKTEIEKRAIKSIQVAQKTLFDNVPKNKIYAIYIKGSFIRREMNEKSDVDIVPITYNNDALDMVRNIELSKGQLYKPSEFVPHSLQEFKQGERYLKYDSPKSRVDTFLRDVHRYKLIFGKPLDIKKYPMRSDIEFLNGHITAFKKTFIPLYNKKEFGFSELMKQVFFLVEREIRLEGKKPPDSWKALAKSIKNKKHIIHDILKYRLYPTKDPRVREDLLKKLNVYIDSLTKKISK